MPAVATISSVIINCARLFDCKKYGAKLLYVFITLPSLTNQTSLVVVFFFFFFFFPRQNGERVAWKFAVVFGFKLCRF
jgi:hypothetical protein